MNILTERDPEIIRNPGKIIFTPMRCSTSSVVGFVEGIKMYEEELIKVLEPTEEITHIDCNFGHKALVEAPKEPEQIIKITKKPAKPKPTKVKPKKAKTKKIQGDGSSFNCMIQFTIPNECIIPFNEKKAKEPGAIEIIEWNGDKFILFKKKYKLKLFRNGSISMSGVLTEDLTDGMVPIVKLCKLIKDQTDMEPVFKRYNSVMRNYKFTLLDKNIDLLALQGYFIDKMKNYKLISFADVEQFVKKPAFTMKMTKSPHFDGWLEYVKYVPGVPVDSHEFDFEILEIMATESKNMKTTFVSSETLEKTITDLIPIKIYKTVAKVAAKFWECAGYYIGDDICELMVGNILKINLEKLHKKLDMSKENQISGFIYDPEGFTAFLMKINSPANKDVKNATAKQSKKDREKQTTIKLYSKGKINIDGANNSEEANYLYYWLNTFLRDTPGILYDPEINMDDLDAEDEWSYSSSDMSDVQDAQESQKAQDT